MKSLSLTIISVFYLLIQLSEQNKTKYERRVKDYKVKIEIYENEDELSTALCKKIEQIANISSKILSQFKIGFTRESLQLLAKKLPQINTDFSIWRYILCEERLVPLTDSDSNYGALLAIVSNISSFNPTDVVKPNVTLEPHIAATDYAARMTDFYLPWELPRLNVLLLDMGEDGHTCSIFPPDFNVYDPEWVIGIDNAPEPPSRRISLTLPVINSAKNAFFIVMGESKADMVKKILEKLPIYDGLPAGLVRLPDGNLTWMLDKGAASKLSK